MKGYLTLAIMISLLVGGDASGEYSSGYGGYSNGGGYASDSSSKIGQYNTGYSESKGGSSSYSTRTYYEPYYYWYCGRRYIGYRAVAVPYQTQPTTVNQPVGAVNTDNSVAYHYEYNITYSQLPQQQGSTLYGYPNPLSANTYQNTDLAVLDQYVRLQSDAQGFLNEGHARTSQRLQELMAVAQIQSLGASNTAEILAKGMAISEMTKSNAAVAAALKSDKEGAIVQQKTTVVQGSGKPVVVPNGQVQAQVQPPRGDPKMTAGTHAQLVTKTTQIFQQKCVRCHNPEKLSGNVDLTDLRKVTPEIAAKVLSRVVDTDPLRRMPLGDNKEPGEPLSMEELRTLFAAAGYQ